MKDLWLISVVVVINLVGIGVIRCVSDHLFTPHGIEFSLYCCRRLLCIIDVCDRL